MKTLIICFSQTGNTRKVAENIRDGIVEMTAQCELASIRTADVDTLNEYDLVGVGCPVFYYKEPLNVSVFLDSLPEVKDKHAFVFSSHGAVPGMALLSMTAKLEKKGFVVIGSHHTYADSIVVPFYPHPTVTTGHPDVRDLQEARDFGKKIARCSMAVAQGDTACIDKPGPVTENWIVEEAEQFTPENIGKFMPRLSINMETCTQCGECQDACPVNGIDIEADPPRVQEPCIYCFYCTKICPTVSVEIECDWGTMLDEVVPANFARYIEVLNRAEERGEFRWLVDPDTIDYKDPIYKQSQRKAKENKA